MSDGIASYDKEDLFSDVPAAELQEAVGDELNQHGNVPVSYRPMLIDAGGRLILLDAGAGKELAAMWGEPVGRLDASLRAAGVDPSDIAIVFISHAHPDHIGGLTMPEGDGRRASFPKARHLISRVEYEFWTSDRVPEEFATFATIVERHLRPLADAGLLDPFDGEPEITPGLSAIATPGHTPGHTALSLSSGERAALLVGDAVLGEAGFEHPEWSSRLETDRQAAVKTRRSLLDRAVEERSVVDGYHLRRPGFVEAEGTAYRFLALA